MKRTLYLLITALALTLPVFSYAGDNDFIQWHTTNIQLLRGFDYKLDPKKSTIITIEHANAWKYGDFFIFVDQMLPDVGESAYYIEPTLRLSSSKIFGLDFSDGIIKDVLLSGQIEKPKDHDIRKLIGVAVDLNLPTFKFFKFNLFRRDNPNVSGHTYQATFVWNRPFEINGTRFLLEGFADIVGTEDRKVSNQLIVPRFLMDVGHTAGMGKNKLWMGVEWQYWHNKYGVDHVTESVPQLQAKYVF